MADLQTEVALIIGGDSTQAQKALAEVNRSVQKLPQDAAKQGRATGNKFGQEMSRAQDRWLKVAENSFRQYGGRVGGIIGNIIGQYDRLNKAVESTNRAMRVSGTGAAGASAGGQIARGAIGAEVAAGGFAGQALASGTGFSLSGLASRQWQNAKRYGLRAGNYIAGNARQDVGRLWGLANQFVRPVGRMDPTGQGQFSFMGGSGSPMYSRPSIGGLLRGGLRANSAINGLLMRGGMALGGPLAAIGGIGLAGLAGLSNARETRVGKENELAKIQQTIKEIESIKNPVERAAAILKKFGDNGLEEFRKLQEGAKQLKEEIGGKGWRTATEGAFQAWSAMKDYWADTWGSIKTTFSNTLGSIIRGITGISDELAQSISEGEQRITQMQANYDKKLAERVKKEQELAKQKEKEKQIAEELNEVQIRMWEEQADIEKQLTVKRQVAAELAKAAIKDKEKELELAKLMLDINKLQEQVEKKKTDAKKDHLDSVKEEAELARRSINDEVSKLQSEEDRKRLSLSELAGMTPSNRSNAMSIRYANQIQEEEALAAQDRASGNFARADVRLNRAEMAKQQLVAAGVLKSTESQEGPEWARKRLEESVLRKSGYKPGETPESILENYIKRYGAVPVIPRNGK